MDLDNNSDTTSCFKIGRVFEDYEKCNRCPLKNTRLCVICKREECFFCKSANICAQIMNKKLVICCGQCRLKINYSEF